jgi:hypothetical protein
MTIARIELLRERALRLKAENALFDLEHPVCAIHPDLREDGAGRIPCPQCQTNDELRSQAIDTVAYMAGGPKPDFLG